MNCHSISILRCHKTLPTFLPLVLITLAAAGVRCLALGDSLWIDELHTSWVVTDGLFDLGPRAQLGNQQAAYFFVPWGVIQLLGESELALRLPSYVAGVALIPAIYFLTRRWTGSELAACTVALIAVLDRQWLFFAQEARVYAIVQLAAVAQFALFAGLLQKPSLRGRMVHVGLISLMFYLHYTTALLVAAEIVAWLTAFFILRKREYAWAKALLDLGLYLLLIAPTLPHVWAVAQRRENWEAFVKQPRDSESLLLFPLDVYLLVPLALAGMFGLWRWFGRRRNAIPHVANRETSEFSPNSYAVLAACWLLVPLAIAWITTSTDLARLYFPRYLIGASAAAVVIAGWCIGLQRTSAARITIATAVIYLAAWYGGWMAGVTYSEGVWIHAREEWREAIAAIAERDAEADASILIDAGFIESDQWFDSSDPLRRAYCSLPLLGIYKLPDSQREIIAFSSKSQQIGESRLAEAKPGTACWVLLRGSGEIAPLFTVRAPAGKAIRLKVIRRDAYGSVMLLKAVVE